MSRRWMHALMVVATLTLAAHPAHAVYHAGDVAPDFRKTDLDGISRTLYQYRGKVVVLFLLGYSCPYCLSDGPSFEADIWQYYRGNRPGQVQALGPDLYNGTSTQLGQFKTTTGATYPLLLNGSTGVADTNLTVAYGQFDNYVVINKSGVIRYNAYDRWPHGNRYHPDEIRATVDSLVNSIVGVGDVPLAGALALRASPNPSRGATTFELSNPGASTASVTVFDLAGREVANIWNRALPQGTTRIAWDGRSPDGSRILPGVYLVRARVGGVELIRRVVLVP